MADADSVAAMRILFVCLGNICRSPSAENVMRAVAEREGILDDLELDSAGTIGIHGGNAPDARMTAAAKGRGITMRGASRQIRSADFTEFDLIVPMDESNVRDLKAWPGAAEGTAKLKLFCEFCEKFTDTHEVPDPYYGGAEGFETVMDLLEDGCEVIARKFKDGTLLKD